MARKKRAEVKQCKSCPWRVGVDPDNDIPRYNRDLHAKLTDTVRSGVESMTGPLRVMACHYSETGKETPCAGWIHNQLGSGNNIGVRMAVMRGQMPIPVVDGGQHETFEDTMPVACRRREVGRG